MGDLLAPMLAADVGVRLPPAAAFGETGRVS
jgi:hypothetical protein